MNSKQYEELQFWRTLIQREGWNKFVERRFNDLKRHRQNIENMDFTGTGLEVGTGCYSMLEWSNADHIESIDPLNDEYKKLIKEKNSSFINLLAENGETLTYPDETFDWVVCFNVIDHTPSPEKMLSEIKRVLKPNGRFYFEVNFDDKLQDLCHYALWDQQMVNKMLKDFTLVSSKVVRNDKDAQSLYYAEYKS